MHKFHYKPLTVILFLLQLDYFSSLLQFVFSFDDIYLVSIITRRCSGLWGFCNKQDKLPERNESHSPLEKTEAGT